MALKKGGEFCAKRVEGPLFSVPKQSDKRSLQEVYCFKEPLFSVSKVRS